MKITIHPQSFIVLRLVIIAVFLFASNAYSQTDSRPAITIFPTVVKGPLLKEPPKITKEQQAQHEKQLEKMWQLRRKEFQLPVDPKARPQVIVPGPESQAATTKDSKTGIIDTPEAAGDFRIFRNVITNTTSNSTTNEPSMGANGRVMFYAGNWYAALSTDYGQTFSYVNPYTTFSSPSGGFCCDQVVYYERTRSVMFWYLQYSGDAVGNTVRIAVATSQANLANNTWHSYEITPQMMGYANGVQFDFPDMAVSNNFLYITTNIIGATDNAIVFRLSLDSLASASGVALYNFVSSLPNLRATQGAGSTMYVGTQVNTSTLRIYTWPESSGSPTSVDRTVNTYYTGSSAPSPDGTDWVARDFNDILAAAIGSGQIVFMWDSAQGGGLTWPNVRYARFNVAGLALADQGSIWNSSFAWAYPAMHPNDRGDMGGTIGVGGGGTSIPYPGVRAWIADSFNSDVIAPLENFFVANGTNGPASDRWGDYFTARRNSPYDYTWNATGFVLNGGQTNAFTEPRHVWFGREQDMPPTTNTIYVNWANVSGYEDGSAAHPYNTVTEGHFAAVANDTLVIQAGAYPETLSLTTPITVLNQGGIVTVGP